MNDTEYNSLITEKINVKRNSLLLSKNDTKIEKALDNNQQIVKNFSGCKIINFIKENNDGEKKVYGCYNCFHRDKNNDYEFICENCYFNCHKNCPEELKTYRTIDKPIKFFCYCALHLKHKIKSNDNQKPETIYTKIGESFKLNNHNLKDKIKKLVDKINYYPFSPVENIRFTNSKFIYFDNENNENKLIENYKNYFENIFYNENEKYKIEEKNKYTNFPLFCFLYYCSNKLFVKIKKLSLYDFIQNDFSIFKYYKDTYLKDKKDYLNKFFNENDENEKISLFSFESQNIIKEQFKNITDKFYFYNIFYYLYYIEFGISYFLFDSKTLLEIIKNIHQITLEIIELKNQLKNHNENIFFNTYKKIFILLFEGIQSYYFLKEEENNSKKNDDNFKNTGSLALICMIQLIDLMIEDQEYNNNNNNNNNNKDNNNNNNNKDNNNNNNNNNNNEKKNIFISQCISILNNTFFHRKIYNSNFEYENNSIEDKLNKTFIDLYYKLSYEIEIKYNNKDNKDKFIVEVNNKFDKNDYTNLLKELENINKKNENKLYFLIENNLDQILMNILKIIIIIEKNNKNSPKIDKNIKDSKKIDKNIKDSIDKKSIDNDTIKKIINVCFEILNFQIKNPVGKKWFMIGESFYILQNIVFGEEYFYNEIKLYDFKISNNEILDDNDIMKGFYEIYSKLSKKFLFKNNKIKHFEYYPHLLKKDNNFISIYYKLYDNRKIEEKEKKIIETFFNEFLDKKDVMNEEEKYKNLLKIYINNMTLYANENLSIDKKKILNKNNKQNNNINNKENDNDFEKLKKMFNKKEFKNIKIFILDALTTSVISDLTNPFKSFPDDFEYYIENKDIKEIINHEEKNIDEKQIENIENLKDIMEIFIKELEILNLEDLKLDNKDNKNIIKYLRQILIILYKFNNFFYSMKNLPYNKLMIPFIEIYDAFLINKDLIYNFLINNNTNIDNDDDNINIYNIKKNNNNNNENQNYYTFFNLSQKLYIELDKFKILFQKEKRKKIIEFEDIYNNVFSDNFMYTYFSNFNKFVNQNFPNILFKFIKINKDETIRIINKILTSKNDFMLQLKKINIIYANKIVNNDNFSFEENYEDYKNFMFVHDCIKIMKEKIFLYFKTFLITEKINPELGKKNFNNFIEYSKLFKNLLENFNSNFHYYIFDDENENKNEKIVKKEPDFFTSGKYFKYYDKYYYIDSNFEKETVYEIYIKFLLIILDIIYTKLNFFKTYINDKYDNIYPSNYSFFIFKYIIDFLMECFMSFNENNIDKISDTISNEIIEYNSFKEGIFKTIENWDGNVIINNKIFDFINTFVAINKKLIDEYENKSNDVNSLIFWYFNILCKMAKKLIRIIFKIENNKNLNECVEKFFVIRTYYNLDYISYYFCQEYILLENIFLFIKILEIKYNYNFFRNLNFKELKETDELNNEAKLFIFHHFDYMCTSIEYKKIFDKENESKENYEINVNAIKKIGNLINNNKDNKNNNKDNKNNNKNNNNNNKDNNNKDNNNNNNNKDNNNNNNNKDNNNLQNKDLNSDNDNKEFSKIFITRKFNNNGFKETIKYFIDNIADHTNHSTKIRSFLNYINILAFSYIFENDNKFTYFLFKIMFIIHTFYIIILNLLLMIFFFKSSNSENFSINILDENHKTRHKIIVICTILVIIFEITYIILFFILKFNRIIFKYINEKKKGLFIPNFINNKKVKKNSLFNFNLFGNKKKNKKINRIIKYEQNKKERQKERKNRIDNINKLFKIKRNIDFFKDDDAIKRRFPTANEVNENLKKLENNKYYCCCCKFKTKTPNLSEIFKKKEKINYCDLILKNFFNMVELLIFLISLILNIIFIITKKYIFIVLQILWVTKHLTPIHNVFYGLKKNLKTIFFTLIFTFIILYIFMWIGFVGFYNLFEFDVIDKEGNSYTEPFCSSSLQCLLIFWSTGFINSGTSDMFNIISFAKNPWFSIGIFFYHLFAFIIINTILSNVFTGLITNGFDLFNDKTKQKQDDIENKCYICNLSKNKADLKGIKFNKHIKEHSLLKYGEFLLYLFTKETIDFTPQEKYIYDKIWDNDISWVPNESDDDDDDDV